MSWWNPWEEDKNTCVVDAKVQEVRLSDIGVDARVLVIKRKSGIDHAICIWIEKDGLMAAWDKNGTRWIGYHTFDDPPYSIASDALIKEGVDVVKSATWL